jgi:hypothetical protein
MDNLGEVAYEAYSAYLTQMGGTPLPYAGLSENEQDAWAAGANAAVAAAEANAEAPASKEAPSTKAKASAEEAAPNDRPTSS